MTDATDLEGRARALQLNCGFSASRIAKLNMAGWRMVRLKWTKERTKFRFLNSTWMEIQQIISSLVSVDNVSTIDPILDSILE
ncbi:hypothetical protein EVAR_78545_1 [Eumeta japonica]|uniref:Uncharacterized protein n=1 Tax=Eumeta variegata TaxID=151549 RepID=A0A4C1W9N1_EUMVA|nr:hypothetical protein EVAR_78545_1 [Eumeta japonica]